MPRFLRRLLLRLLPRLLLRLPPRLLLRLLLRFLLRLRRAFACSTRMLRLMGPFTLGERTAAASVRFLHPCLRFLGIRRAFSDQQISTLLKRAARCCFQSLLLRLLSARLFVEHSLPIYDSKMEALAAAFLNGVQSGFSRRGSHRRSFFAYDSDLIRSLLLRFVCFLRLYSARLFVEHSLISTLKRGARWCF